MNSTNGTGGGFFNAYFVARVLLSVVFLISGINILPAFPMVAADAAAHGIPAATVAVGLSVALDIIGGLLVIANRYVWAVGLLWLAFLIIATPVYHWPWVNGAADFIQTNMFLKNVSIAGGVLLLVIMDKRKPASLSWLG